MLPLVTLSLLSALSVAPNYQNGQASSTPAPAITTVLPADVPVVGLVNTKAEAWRALERFQLFQTAYTAAGQFFPASVQLDYVQDIGSWLGDHVAFAFMPKAGSDEVTLKSSFLMLALVKDESRLQAFVEKLKASKQQRLSERQYKGVTILEWKAPEPRPPQSTPSSPQKPKQRTLTQAYSQQERRLLPDSAGQVQVVKSKTKPQLLQSQLLALPIPNLPQPNSLNKERGLAIAVLPGYLVAANSAKPIEQLIDTPKGSNTLAQNPQFQRTTQHPQFNQALFTLYEDPAKFLSLFKSLAKDPSLPFPFFIPDEIRPEQLQEYSTLGSLLLVQPEGLRFQINAYRQTPRTTQVDVPLAEGSQILARLPAATYSVANSRHLNQQWEKLVAQFDADPKLKYGLTQFRHFVRTSTELDFDRDVISWMNGENAFFLYPTKGGLSSFIGPKFNLGIGFLVQTSNRPAAEATMKKLDQFVKSFSKGLVAVASRSIKGEPVTSWEMKGGTSAQSLFAYSWVDDNTLLVTTGFGAIADLVPQPQEPLPKTYTFTTAIRSLPYNNGGYFYMNMGSFLSWIYGFLPIEFNNEDSRKLKQVIGTVRSISATSSTMAERDQYDGLVVLAPARTAPALRAP